MKKKTKNSLYSSDEARKDREKCLSYENNKELCDEVLNEIKKIARNGGQGYILSEEYSMSDIIIIQNALSPLGYSIESYDGVAWVAW
jgi:hypothetical protein